MLAILSLGQAQTVQLAEEIAPPEATPTGYPLALPNAQIARPPGIGEKLQLSDTIASVYRSFPEIEAARLEQSRAAGQQLAAFGFYDTKLEGYTLSEPTGFYENYRHGIGVARQTWWGGYLSAGYRIGRGEFQPWYKERQTNEGGELKLSTSIPLLAGRAIDAQRVAVFQASLARQAALPTVQRTILDVAREAALAYWTWVANGSMVEVQQELLQLAEDRGAKIDAGVQAGRFAEIDLIFNQQLIAERRTKLLETEQKFRAAAYKLSLFLRDPEGRPLVPAEDWLPELFPEIPQMPVGDFQADLAAALERRPESRLLRLDIQQFRLDAQLANNLLLPQVDVVAEASQDVGLPASSLNDKGQFELLVGLQGEVPIQRRKARGKLQESTAKVAQLTQKLRLQQDKIGIELQTAHNALTQSSLIVEQAETSLKIALDSLRRYRVAFDRGKADLIYINLLESKVNEDEIKLVDAQRSWFIALAEMQAALGLDPLEQALLVDELAPSSLTLPGHILQSEP